MKFVKLTLIAVLMVTMVLAAKAQKSKDVPKPKFFTIKYTKEKVWDAQRSPAYPATGKDWKLSGFKGVKGGDGKTLDWGKANDRYLMFFSEVDEKKLATSLIDDVNNSGKKYTIVLKLFEADGTLVKVVSKKGKIIGQGEPGFMYEIEGRYGAFFSTGTITSKDVIKYRPSILKVTKLSELNNK